MTNILSLPQRVDPDDLVTFTNSGWIDTFAFEVAGSAAGYASAGNTGTGSLTIGSLAPQTALGSHELEIVEAGSGPARFVVRDPSGSLTQIGLVGTSVSAGGITFSLAQSTAFAVGDTFTIGVLPTPVDITGIAFALMLRRSASAATVSLSASTATGTIGNGGLSGIAAMAVPQATMAALAAGSYPYDLVASADGYSLVVRAGTVTHRQGITTLS